MTDVLVAGIGNIFLGDDAFGVEVVQRLARRQLPAGVRVVDFGIRGFDLAHALLEPYAAVIFVDATPRDGTPGTLYVVEPDAAQFQSPELPAALEPHALDPLRVLRLAWSMGARPQRVLVVGCEPSPLDEEEYAVGSMGLSEPVHAALEEAVSIVESLLAQVLGEVVVRA
jgi:hydrogenase maturation protease